jgi:hypothetical protein
LTKPVSKLQETAAKKVKYGEPREEFASLRGIIPFRNVYKSNQCQLSDRIALSMERQMRQFKMKPMMLLVAVLALLGFGTASAQAVTLDDIFQVSAETNKRAQESQTRIDNLSEETARLLIQYKTVLKEVESLRVYNTQLQRQIDNQNLKITQLRDSIERVTLIERQITPLMLRMIDSLEAFVNNDVPFLLAERQTRIQTLREIMDQSDVTPSEKFRSTFEAYQIENNYGRTIEAYSGSLQIPGAGERQVNFLRIGRVGLYYQTLDGSLSGTWDKKNGGSWQELDEGYRSAINEGIRIASQQTAPNLIRLPVGAPE